MGKPHDQGPNQLAFLENGLPGTTLPPTCPLCSCLPDHTAPAALGALSLGGTGRDGGAAAFYYKALSFWKPGAHVAST